VDPLPEAGLERSERLRLLRAEDDGVGPGWCQAASLFEDAVRVGGACLLHNLQPGDLVFYYSPISHVSIYIGNGLIVDAANPGARVRVAGVFSMPFSGAVRPG
jgi:hypothetical protein